MRTAVAGATGNIGSLTVAALRGAGHDVVPLSRADGVDLVSGRGLDGVLDGVEAVVDVTNGGSTDPEETVAYFEAMAGTLLAAETAAGVRHHVLLSIVGLHRVTGNAHYAAKRAQEAVVRQGAVPWTIVPATQFHDFPAMVTGWCEVDGTARVAPLRLQPVAPSDVADVLAEVALGGRALGDHVDVAGPEPRDLIDLAERTNEARGHHVTLVPTWDGLFGSEMAGDVLLPGPDARIMPTTFEEWLAAQ